MKLDIKSIVILILLGTSIFFFATWFFRGTDYKSEIEKLEDKNRLIELSRDSLKKNDIVLAKQYAEKDKQISDRENQIKEIESQLLKVKQDLTISNNKVRQNQKDLEETKKKIEELKNNPIKRDDEDLIKSLKDKLNK